MLSKIKNNIATTLVALSLLVIPALALGTTAVNAQTKNLSDNVCSGADNLSLGTIGDAGATTCKDVGEGTGANVDRLITQIINVFSIVVGIVAVIMIIVGGLKYITSGGDSGKVTSAKNSIIYAIIGLVIVALAQVIVRFVLSKATDTTA